jgi:peptidoglycan/LPS O-acetylase OafA/YrhL
VESLTGLRWWAALMVFFHHMSQLAPLPIYNQLKVGPAGVAFFFVLSGFVLTWSAFPGDTAPRFYWRRFARIVPLCTLTTLLAIPVFYPHYKPWNLAAIVLCLVFLQAWSTDVFILYGGNPAAWSLSCEMFFYALFPFVCRPSMRLSRRWLLVAAVVTTLVMLAIGLMRARPGGDLARQVPFPILRSFEFFIGVFLAGAMRKGWRCPVPVWTALCTLGAGLVVVGSVPMPAWVPGPSDLMRMEDQLLTPFFALAIVAVATRDIAGGRSLLRSRPLVRLGQWSYAFYLTHATVLYGLRLLTHTHPLGWRNLTWYAFVLALAIAVAGLLYRFVEYPVERRLRRMVRNEPPMPVPV